MSTLQQRVSNFLEMDYPFIDEFNMVKSYGGGLYEYWLNDSSGTEINQKYNAAVHLQSSGDGWDVTLELTNLARRVFEVYRWGGTLSGLDVSKKVWEFLNNYLRSGVPSGWKREAKESGEKLGTYLKSLKKKRKESMDTRAKVKRFLNEGVTPDLEQGTRVRVTQQGSAQSGKEGELLAASEDGKEFAVKLDGDSQPFRIFHAFGLEVVK
jgi:hypothetical protein